jgi:hypothetical protein
MSHWIDFGLTALMAALALYSLAMIVSCTLRQYRAGGLIVDGSRPRRLSRLVWPLLVLALFILTLVIEGPRNWNAYNPLALAIVLFYDWYAHRIVELRTNGIFASGYLIPWQRIKAWHWQSLAQREHAYPSLAIAGAFTGAPQALPMDSEPDDQKNAKLVVEVFRRALFRRWFELQIAMSSVREVDSVMTAYVRSV